MVDVRVSRKKPSSLLPDILGNAASSVLLLRPFPHALEVRTGEGYVHPAGRNFRELWEAESPVSLEDVATAFVVNEPVHKLLVKFMRSNTTLKPILELGDWKTVVCVGREVMKHIYLRGGPAPSLDTLSGRFVDVRGSAARITAIPDLEYMLSDRDQTRYGESVESMRLCVLTIQAVSVENSL